MNIHSPYNPGNIPVPWASYSPQLLILFRVRLSSNVVSSIVDGGLPVSLYASKVNFHICDVCTLICLYFCSLLKHLALCVRPLAMRSFNASTPSCKAASIRSRADALKLCSRKAFGSIWPGGLPIPILSRANSSFPRK